MRIRPLLLLSCVAPAAAGAQGAAPLRDPTQVAAAFFAAAAAGRWRDAAAHLDLEAFDAYRREQVSSIRSAVPPPPTTAEELMRREPDMPREVAEYQARKMNEARGRFGEWISREFAGVTRLDSLAALPPIEAAARWLEAQDPRYQMRLALKDARAWRNCPDSVAAAALDLPGEPPRVIVGAVVLDSVAYVLHRERADVRPADSSEQRRERRAARRQPERSWFAEAPTVLQLRRVAGEWRIFGGFRLLDGSMGVAVSVDCVPLKPGG